MIINLYELSYESYTLYLNSSNNDIDLGVAGYYYAAPGQFGEVTHDLKEDTNEVEWKMPYYFTRYERASIPIVDLILKYISDCSGLGYAKLVVKRYNFETDDTVTIFTGVGDTFGMADDMFGIKFRSLYSTLSGLGTRLICSPQCTTELYSTKCGLSKASYTYTGTITTISDDRVEITASVFGDYADNWFEYGYIICENEYKYVLEHTQSTSTIIIISPFSTNVEVGSTFTIYAGCDKSITMCKDKFDNVTNFYGFPYVPLEVAIYRGMTGSGADMGGSS